MIQAPEKVETHREPLPLAYAVREEKPPIDWWCAIRQIIFAAGAGFVAGGWVAMVYSFQAWKDNEVVWIGCGVAMMALVIPFPCGFRRVRPQREPR